MRMAENLRQLKEHRGPYFIRWRARLAAAVRSPLAELGESGEDD